MPHEELEGRECETVSHARFLKVGKWESGKVGLSLSHFLTFPPALRRTVRCLIGAPDTGPDPSRAPQSSGRQSSGATSKSHNPDAHNARDPARALFPRAQWR